MIQNLVRKPILLTILLLQSVWNVGLAETLSSQTIVLKNDIWQIQINPFTLEMVAIPQGQSKLSISQGQAGYGPILDLKQNEGFAEWNTEAIAVSLQLIDRDLKVTFTSQKEGHFTWPIIEQTQKTKALILPRNEGAYIPVNDQLWRTFLTEYPRLVTEFLMMPFWGIEYESTLLTYLLTNPYDNEKP